MKKDNNAGNKASKQARKQASEEIIENKCTHTTELSQAANYIFLLYW